MYALGFDVDQEVCANVSDVMAEGWWLRCFVKGNLGGYCKYVCSDNFVAAVEVWR